MKSPVRNTLLLGVVLGLAIGLGGFTFIYSKGYSYLTTIIRSSCAEDTVCSTRAFRRFTRRPSPPTTA